MKVDGATEDGATIRTEAYASDGSLVPVSILIDECSDTTLFNEPLFRRLKLRGIATALDLVGVTEARRYNSHRTELKLRLPDGETASISGFTIPQVPRPTPVVNWTELQSRWSHLQNLPLQPSGGKMDILLDVDHPHLLAVLESRVGGKDEPFTS